MLWRRLPPRSPRLLIARWLFLRGLGVTWLVAFTSLRRQVLGLYGSRGLTPLARRLERMKQHTKPGERAATFPSLFWLDASDRTLVAACRAGQLLAALLTLGIAPRLTSLLLWGNYLSFVTVGPPFLNYQWDALVLEAGLPAALVAPGGLRPGLGRRAPSWAAVAVMRWLVFRLHFESGIAKLQSKDETWRSLTALRFHHQTQPLPTPLGWYAHHLPDKVQKATTAATLVSELALPPLALLPGHFRRAAAAGFIGLQGAIAASGNYGFFNLLSTVLCAWLLDDPLLAKLPFVRRPGRAARAPRWQSALEGALLLPLLVSSLDELVSRFRPHRLPGALRPMVQWPRRLHAISPYGLFSVMTTSRPEVTIEGSWDGNAWTEIDFRYKPGAPGRRPRFVAPHMPRLDWQMWFLALGNVGEWFGVFLERLLEGAPEVYALLAPTPFRERPPKYVRAVLYEYRMTSREERRKTGAWWSRERQGLFISPVTLAPGQQAPVQRAPWVEVT